MREMPEPPLSALSGKSNSFMSISKYEASISKYQTLIIKIPNIKISGTPWREMPELPLSGKSNSFR